MVAMCDDGGGSSVCDGNVADIGGDRRHWHVNEWMLLKLAM